MFSRKLLYEDDDFVIITRMLSNNIKIIVKNRGISIAATANESAFLYQILIAAQRQGMKMVPPDPEVAECFRSFANAIFYRGRAAYIAFFDPRRLQNL